MNVGSVKIIGINYFFCEDDFVLLEPVKSAEPPISSGINVVISSRHASEDFLVAIGFEFSKNLSLIWLIFSLKFFW